MSIAQTGAYEEEVGGKSRRLLLRNREIERFEAQYDVGIFELWDQLFGRGGRAPQARHVRDLVALALVGGGMSDRAAEDLVADLPPSENMRLRQIAQRVLGVAFIPAVLGEDKKKADGSGADASAPPATTVPASGS
ncbi:gene transfer agent family protein [Salipiger thiooxidans]|uniref:GTA-gp10 family protein n=1 Tax=Salipiger thiooxidans TaxID=282683 RepID=UPI001A90481C|nr:gene transfer agent family protein [Salipiger thiooxidans]